MNRKIVKIAAFMLSALLAVLVFPSAAKAAEQEKKLFSLSETKNMSIMITYDKEEPDIAFVAPDGTVYAEGSENVTVVRKDKKLNFMIEQCSAGDWYIRYDKKSNGTVEVSYAPYSLGVEITKFNWTIDENTVNFTFSADHPNADTYNWTLYAVTLDGNGSVEGTAELKSGTARIGGDTDSRASLTGLTSWDNYHFMLEVWLTDSGSEVSDSMVSEKSFAYTNPNESKAPENVEVTVDLSSYEVIVNWAKSGSGEFVVAVYDYVSGTDPVYHNSFEDDYSTAVLLDPNAKDITVKVWRRSGGKAGAPCVYDIPIADSSTKVSIITGEYTNAVQGAVEYSADADTKATLTVNGTSEELLLSGAGSFSFDLPLAENEVSVVYSCAENVFYKVSKKITVDRTAPVLILYENTGTIKTGKASYTLVGETESGCVLKINGTEHEIGSNGVFTCDLSLSSGENTFEMTVTDSAGNMTVQTVIIEMNPSDMVSAVKSGGSLKSFIPFIISLLCAALGVFGVFRYTKVWKENSEKDKIGTILKIVGEVLFIIGALLLIGAIVLLVLWIIAAGKVSSQEFVNTAVQSVNKAYELIKTRDGYMGGFIGTLAAGLLTGGAGTAICIFNDKIKALLDKKSEN